MGLLVLTVLVGSVGTGTRGRGGCNNLPKPYPSTTTETHSPLRNMGTGKNFVVSKLISDVSKM